MRAYQNNKAKIAVLAMVVVFLALVRTLAEPFRLHYLKVPLQYPVLQPLLIGSLVAAAGLFTMAMFSFNKKYDAINIAGLGTLVFLLAVKAAFKIT